MEETLYSLFEKAAEKYRTEIAIIENNRTLTFGELFDLVDLIAESFPQKVSSIGIVMKHRAEMRMSILF